ncbi:CBS domain protein [Aestuariispira insulae]|uniref:CBS domain protein n=2 Tax=Aestuariispira insulae TaxID=1461337 RepID=A0A3D9HXG6_9PROT|nr:CBS domain protein [Aestuariispira insulae]
MTSYYHQQTAADLMTRECVTIREDENLETAASRILGQGVSNVPVIREESGKRILLGFLSEKDLLECFFDSTLYQSPDVPIARKARMNPVCVRADTDLPTLSCIFLQHKFRHMPVVEDGEFLGMVSRRDILRGFLKHYQEQLKKEPAERKTPEMDDTYNSRFIVG